MYSHCLFCTESFGTNQELEQLPVGRRVAFDAAKGRLWVVCRYCARWNLVPFEDRWETIDACERRFRGTLVRVSTSNVGLARLPEGLELVRIGSPLRPEFAAWRYGATFIRRHQRGRARKLLKRIGPAMMVIGPAASVVFGPIAPVVFGAAALGGLYHLTRKPDLKFATEAEGEVELSADAVKNALLIRDDTSPDGWAIMVQRLERLTRNDLLKFGRDPDPNWAVLYGRDARLAASLLLPKLNPVGGDEATVTEAVRWLEASGGPLGAFHTFSRSHLVRMPLDNTESRLTTLHAEVRLALEMALHEEEERRALAGELSVLEWVWQHEEMLADLADGLGQPADLEAQLDALRSQGSLPASGET
ncbi:MAG: hypothetical protein R2882_11690 [Gemmatimonadales bacterium]